MKERKLGGALALVCGVLSFACNSLLGIDPPLAEGDDDGGEEECVLSSDCERRDHLCLFRVCSPECAPSEGDKDCAKGFRCLATEEGTACVSARQAACSDELPCPGGTVCVGEECRIACDPEAPAEETACLEGQLCSDAGACVGDDPDHDETGGACEAGETQCTSGGRRQTCSTSGVWGTPTDCPFVCAEGECTGSCVPDDVGCAADGTTRQTCSEAGQWEDQGSPCEGVCTAGRCEDTCEEGSHQCSGSDGRLLCEKGKWITDEPCPFVCEAATGDCVGDCEPGAHGCSENQLQICSASGGWTYVTTCPYACLATGGTPAFACGGVCVPTHQECQGNAVATCTSAGEWSGTLVDCDDSDQTCAESGSSASCGGECSPGQTTCEGWHPFECEGGTFVQSDTCAQPSEICRNGACEANVSYSLGNSTGSWPFTNTVANRIYTVPIVATHNATVQRVRFRTGSTSGASAMGLIYADASGAPGALLQQTNSTTVASGDNERTPQGAALALEAGKTYWVGLFVSGAVPLLYTNAGASPPRYVKTATYPTVPDPFGSASSETDFTWSIYLTVRDTP